MMALTMRDARPEDCDRVFAWNCTPEVRALSGDPRVIEMSEHVRWYERRLRARGPFWIVENEGVPVGVLRLDPTDAGTAISISLSPRARGLGIGRRAIAAACLAWNQPVIAVIRTTNIASRTCFEACGFEVTAEHDEFITYRWSP